MRILAASQSCVVDVNQLLFVALNARDDVDVQLIVPSYWKSEYNFQLMKPKVHDKVDFTIHFVPVFFKGNNSLHFYKNIPIKRLDNFRPDIVYSTMEPWSVSNFQLLLLSKRWKSKFFFHTNQNIFKRYPFPFSVFESITINQCAMAFCYSLEAQKLIAAKGFRKESMVVPYGTDLGNFYPGNEMMLRSTLGLGDSIVVGFVGRFVYEKGIDLLIQSIHKVKMMNMQIKCLIIGSGPDESRIKSIISQLNIDNDVYFHDFIPHKEVASYFRCMDIFVLPSRTTNKWKEQFGRVIIEALASGVPVIGSDSGEIPNLIRALNGGLVFREDDVADLSEKLFRLASDAALRHQLGSQGRAIVQQSYTFDAVANRLHESFSRALSGHAHSTKL